MTPPESTIQKGASFALSRMPSTPDFDIPATWLLLPLASYLGWAAFLVVWWMGGFGLGKVSLGALGVIYLDLTGVLGIMGILAMALSLGSSYVFYAIMSRGYAHYARMQIFLLKTISVLESRVGFQPSPASFALNSAAVNMQRLVHSERERSSFLWAVLSMTPFIGWIFVLGGQLLASRDFVTHTRLEGIVFEDVDRTMKTVGLRGFQLQNVPVSPRYVLAPATTLVCCLELFSALIWGLQGALILIYLTLGIASLVCIDLLARDPRGHLQYDNALESEVLGLLKDTMGPEGRLS